MDRLVRELGPWERGIRFTAYALFALSGAWIPFLVFGMVAHPFPWLGVSIFLSFGGAASAWGTLTGKWIGEYVGLWFVVSALIGFGVLQLAASSYSWQAVPGVALLWGFACLTLSRWTVVRLLFKSLHRAKRAHT